MTTTGARLLGRIRNRSARLAQRRWRTRPYTSDQRHIIMGGAPRSGTTLLRRLFDRHPDVCAGAETKLFIPAAFNLSWLAEAYAIPLADLQRMRREAESQGAFVDAFADRVTSDQGKGRWAEKTPMNIRNLDWIMPRWRQAAVVDLIRDGRDVVCSMREHPDWRWVDGAWQKTLVPRSIEAYAKRWLADTATGMSWRDDPRYVEVRYEDLVADPGTILKEVCAAIGLVAEPDWLGSVTKPAADDDAGPDYEGAISTVSVGRWRTDLSAAEQDEVTRLCGPRLLELGYEL